MSTTRMLFGTRACGERVAGARGNDALVPAEQQFARQEQRLALATTPTALGVHLENAQGHRTTSSAPATERKPRGDRLRILLVALDNLGDLVFASALAPPLHQAFPNAVIDLWCKRYTSSVGALVPHVHTVIASDPFWAVAPGHRRPPVWPMLRSIGVARRGRYDIAVLSEAPWRVAAAVAAAGIPMRIGLARHRNATLSDPPSRRARHPQACGARTSTTARRARPPIKQSSLRAGPRAPRQRRRAGGGAASGAGCRASPVRQRARPMRTARRVDPGRVCTPRSGIAGRVDRHDEGPRRTAPLVHPSARNLCRPTRRRITCGDGCRAVTRVRVRRTRLGSPSHRSSVRRTSGRRVRARPT